jgi:hypothetical protein
VTKWSCRVADYVATLWPPTLCIRLLQPDMLLAGVVVLCGNIAAAPPAGPGSHCIGAPWISAARLWFQVIGTARGTFEL